MWEIGRYNKGEYTTNTMYTVYLTIKIILILKFPV